MVLSGSERMKDRSDIFTQAVLTLAFGAFVLACAYWIASWAYVAGHPVYWDMQAKRYVEIGR
jgi:hypothetical protein